MADPRRTSSRTGRVSHRLRALAGLLVIVGLALGGLALVGVLGNQGGGEGIESVRLLDTAGAAELQVGPEAGKLAPDFEISAFDGSRHRLSDFRGKVVYVNFWATWCIPCQVELPHVQELLNRHGDQLVVVTVNRREPLDRAQSYFDNLPRLDGGRGVSFTVNGMDADDTLYQEYRALGMPVSVFVDANGVVTRFVNGLIVLEQMEQLLQEALSSSSQAAVR